MANGTRILYLAEYAPEGPDFTVKSHPGDGGYPAYYYEVWERLRSIGYHVRSTCSANAVLFARGNVDFVFSLYNRMPINNSEVFVSAACEYARIPYLGARPNIRALAEDKWLSKLAAASCGMPVAVGIPYDTVRALDTPPKFEGPYFVKDRYGAGSEGVSDQNIQDTWEGARGVAERLLTDGCSVLVEQYADGIDVTVPVLGGDDPLVLGFVHPRSNKPGSILTEDLKMGDPLGYEVCAVGAHEQAFTRDVLSLWSMAGPIDYFRLDYRFDERTGRRTFLEFNVCCYIGSSGAICLAANEHGLTQEDVLGHVVEYSLRRQSAGRQHLEWVL